MFIFEPDLSSPNIHLHGRGRRARGQRHRREGCGADGIGPRGGRGLRGQVRTRGGGDAETFQRALELSWKNGKNKGNIGIFTFLVELPVVPHKAVAEVSE